MWSSWQQATDHLQHHVGDWWLVSPYITTVPAALGAAARKNDLSDVYVLTSADPADFARGSSSLDVLRDLVGRGAQVRALDRLHAKVYLRRQGGAAVGWLGSANLTERARSTNEEVMSGAQVFDQAFLRHLDGLWNQAKRLDSPALTVLARQVEEEIKRQQPNSAVLTRVVVFSIEERKAGKQFDIEHSLLKLGIDQKTARNIRTQAVSFIDSEYREDLQAWRREQLDLLTRGKPPLMVRLPGGNTLYACAARNRSDVERTLRDLDRQGRARISELRSGSRDLLKEKFFSHLDTWRKAYGGQVEARTVAELFLRASEEFDRYLASEVFGVDYSLLAPMFPEDRQHPWFKILKGLEDAPEPMLFM